MENMKDNSRCITKRKIVGQQNKMKQVMESKEYISCLPYAVMLHIFSLLPLDTLILISLVSKQWESLVKDLLSLIPSSLNLNELEMAGKIIRTNIEILQSRNINLPNMYQLCHRYSIIVGSKNFTQFVNRTLYLHTGCIIKKLCFNLCYDGLRCSQEKVDKWFHFALTNEVKELELDFSEGKSMGFDGRAYEMPHKQCASKSLELVNLNSCKLGISNLGVFGSIQCLFLKFVKVLGFSIEDLVTKCPLLKDLKIEGCSIPFNFMISRRDIMIKSLTIIKCFTQNWPICPIDISAPELLIFTLEGWHLSIKTNIKAPNLTDLVITIKELHTDGTQREALVKLLGCSNRCQTLSLNTWCIQVLSYGAYFLQQSPILFYNLKYLKLRVGLRKEELPGITYMMRSCPCMESLTLYINESIGIQWGDLGGGIPIVFDFEEDHYWQTHASALHCLQYCLKEVLVYGIFGRSHEIKMLGFLLENAKVLKDMSLCFWGETLGQEVLQQLSTYRKTSPQAIISIKKI